MAQQELLVNIVRAIERAGLEYMLTGSIVSSLQGEPRSTHGIDVVVVLRSDAIPILAQAFPWPDYYFDEQMARDALRLNSMFGLLDQRSGDKVDFWLLTGEPFDRSRFARRYAENVLGVNAYVSSPEDTILAKLRWSAMSGGSERQFRDALSVYELQFRSLDMDYIEQWVKKLTVELYWQRLKNEAHPLR